VLNEDNQALGWLADCNSLNATYPSGDLSLQQQECIYMTVV